MKHYFNSNGEKLSLGREYGRGGEGTVFEIVEWRGSVAKIYHGPLSGSQKAKLKGMASLKTPELLSIAAWPTDSLHLAPGGDVVGFVMPKIEGYKPVHELYSPKSRRVEFPTADWRFLIHTAANVSRAFTIVHQDGHVIGDVNHGNLVVARDGTVKLIDCDSFQVTVGTRAFYCGVGIAEYTPPELFDVDFEKIPRTQNHDAFGLAVLNFHLLFMGRHPFAGRYMGHGYMPIDRAIKEHRFVYGPGAKAMLMEPPPYSLAFSALNDTVANLFENAFKPVHLQYTRPSAKDWVSALVEMGQNLKPCVHSSSHYYVNTLTYCPWCQLDATLGIDFFPSGSAGHIHVFNLEATWKKILSIKRPANIEITNQSVVSLSKQANWAKMRLRFKYPIFLLCSYIAYVVVTQVSDLSYAPLVYLVLLFFVYFMFPKKGRIRKRFKKQADLAKTEFDAIASSLNNRLREFDVELNALKKKKVAYQNLPLVRAKELEDLKLNIREDQLNKYLEQFEIKTASLKNIGEGRKQMLLSFGIETASDIVAKTVAKVPGFGPTFTQTLLDWRNDCSLGFVFDPFKGVDPNDMARVNKKLNDKGLALEKELNRGANILQNILNDFDRLQNIQKAQLEILEYEYTQAIVDFEYLDNA